MPQVVRYVFNSIKELSKKMGNEVRQAVQRGLEAIVSAHKTAHMPSTAPVSQGESPASRVVASMFAHDAST